MSKAVADIEPITLRSLSRPGIETICRLWKPFVLIQLLGLGLVLAYFYWPPMTRFCLHLQDIKLHWGFLFSSIITAFAGAIVPEIARTLVLGEWHFDHERRGKILHTLVLFAYVGVLTDAFYRMLGVVIGDDGRFATSLIKTLIDQSLFTLVIGVPTHVFSWTWRRNQYNLRRTWNELGFRWYLQRVIPVILPCWCFWTPMCLLAYSLPNLLQFSFFTVGNCAWGLIVVAVASREKA